MCMNSCLILPSPLSSFLLPSGKNPLKSKDLSFTQHDSGASAASTLWTLVPGSQQATRGVLIVTVSFDTDQQA